MRTLALALGGLLWVSAAAADEVPAPSGKLVDPDAKLELIFTRSLPIKGGLTEGPAPAPDGSIYFSDIPFGPDKGKIMRFDPKTKETTVFAEDSHKSNGLKFDAKGFLIACEGSDGGGQCVSRWDVRTKERTVLADKYQGKRLNAPNDLTIDRHGRIYFSDPRYLGFEPREQEKDRVYRLDPDGTVIAISEHAEKPNGVVLSPDNKTLYVADHNNGTFRIDPEAPAPKKGAMRLYALPLGKDGKVHGKARTLIDFGEEDGIDGMTIDTDGNLWLAVRSQKKPGVWVVDPSGKELGYIPTGPAQPGAKEAHGIPANVCFGTGQESNVLYVTVDKSLYRIRTKATGYHIPWSKSVGRANR